MPQLNPGEAEYQYLSDTAELPAGVGDPINLEFIVPDGFSTIDQIIFDPDKNILFTLKAPKLSNALIFDNASTKIGSAVGILPVGVKGIEGDRLKLSGKAVGNVVAGDLATFTLRFGLG